MSKKLGPEIEKCLREAQTNIHIYDTKWKELKAYNEATANPDWASMGNGIIRIAVPEPVTLGGLKPKQSRSGLAGAGSVITVDTSVMTEKQVAEAKERLKNELESLMKKVYRSRQMIIEWLNIPAAELVRTTGFRRDELYEGKKEIENRHRKGKIYYLNGVSSEDIYNSNILLYKYHLEWIHNFIKLFQYKYDYYMSIYEKEVESSDQNPDRITALANTIDTYSTHAEKLDDCLRRLRNNAINLSGGDGGDEISGGGDSHQSTDGPATSTPGDTVDRLLQRLSDLKETLQPLAEASEDAILGDESLLVPIDIYDDLLADPGLHPASNKKDTGEAGTPPKPTTQPQPQPTQKTLPDTQQQQPQQTSQPPQEEEPRREDTSLPTGPQPGLSYRNVVQSSTSAATGPSSEAALLRSRLEQLRQTQSSVNVEWPEAAGLELSEGVTTDVLDEAVLEGLPKHQRENLLKLLESTAVRHVAGEPSVPVLIFDEEVQVVQASGSWEPARHMLMNNGCESPLLKLNQGSLVEVIAQATRHRWTFGRLQSDRGQEGWFPSDLVIPVKNSGR